MDVGYAEKTFETFIDAELLSKYGKGWAPGQYEEGFVGFDFYFEMSAIKHFFHFRKLFKYYRGIDITDILTYVEKKAHVILRGMPKIKTNILFQYKCPEYMTMSNASEWNNWKGAYFRFKIDSKQQKLIEDIHNSFPQVLVLYAAPAIKTSDELYKAAAKKKIIKNTNFTEGYKLSNHKVNTYQNAGKYSIACSEPEKIESFQLEELKDRIINENNLDNRDYYIKFAEYIKTLMNKDRDNLFAYNILLKNIINEEDINLEEYPLINSFLIIDIFKEITGISTYMYI